jgi:hypothetical protein
MNPETRNGHCPATTFAGANAPGEDTSQPILQDLGPLAGLPGDARFVPVVGKNPSQTGWNTDPSVWLTAEQALKVRALAEGRWTGIGLLTGRKVGRLCWLDFDGEEVNEDGELVRSASTDFEALFLRRPEELPASPVSVSGRVGRCRRLFRVPEEWCDYLAGFSITNGGPTGSFDVLYEKAGGKLFHAVVEGTHPDGQGWYYRWEEGCSPAEVEIPDLPAWVIAGLVRFIANKARAQQESAERVEEPRSGGETGPMDLLSPGQQRKLLRTMQKFWPYRANREEFSAHELGAKGHYEVIRRLVLSLAKGIGDADTMELWLVGGHWDRLNQWAGGDGVNAVSGGSLMTLAVSLLKSETEGTQVEPWGAAWKLAVENGWKAPKWALPPRELNATTLTTGVTKKLEELKKALVIIDEMDSPLERECAYQNLAKSLDCTEKELKMLLRHIQEEGNPAVGGDWNQVVKNAKRIEVAVERLLAFNALTIVASDGGVGKSVLIYRLAEAAANGGLFAGCLPAVQGKVLIVQKDESDSNLAAKDAVMQAKMPDGIVRVEFSFNGGMMPELRKWIREHGARYVFMDSLFSLFGTDGDLTEGAIGTYMYLLNQMAAEENCAILLTHHLRKADKSKSGKRAEVHMQDLYGSSFIVNGTSDVWGVVRDPASPADAPKFVLKVLKPRTGVTTGGDTYVLSGSTEDFSFELEQLNNQKSRDEIEKLRKSEQLVLRALRERTSVESGLRIVDMASIGVSQSGITKALRTLLADPAYGVKREALPGSSGRPTYVYWAG